MSLLTSPSVAPTSILDDATRIDELEQLFRDWADDPIHPDTVVIAQHGDAPMVEVLRRLTGSDAPLAACSSRGLGLAPGTSIATAATALLWATVDPDGPRCRSFRASTFFLRGLVRLDDGADDDDRVARTYT